MAKKNTQESKEAPVPTPVQRTAFEILGRPETKAELLSLYELLNSMGITQISILEGMIGRAE